MEPGKEQMVPKEGSRLDSRFSETMEMVSSEIRLEAAERSEETSGRAFGEVPGQREQAAKTTDFLRKIYRVVE